MIYITPDQNKQTAYICRKIHTFAALTITIHMKMKMRLIVCLTFLVLFSMKPWNPLVAQPVIDTLEQVKALRDQGNLKAALKLLEPYNAAHPKDLNSSWLYAQTAYWSKHNKLSQEVYESAIGYNPENLYLQVDYANMLVNIGKYDKAMPYLENFLIYYPGNTQVELTLAKVAFWKGNYKEAMMKTEELVKRDSGISDQKTREAISLLDEILLAKSPWIGITGSYYTDNQPLQTISPVLESNIWLHPLSTLRFSVRSPFFSQGDTITNALWLQAGNDMFISYGNWNVITDVGFLKYPYKNTTTWTANFELKKRSYRHLVTIFQAERKPYFSTGSSIDTVILEYHVAETVSWDNFDSWNGQISYNWDYFLTDYNSIYAFGAWGLAPPIKVSVFDFRLGYGFSYSTSNKNNFVYEGNKAEIIANYDPDVGIKGIYYPYFTPKQQMINSALLSIGIHPAKGFDIGITGNVGFYATAQIPYFYPDTNGAGGYVIKKDFSKERYIPYTISAFASVQLSKKVSIRADYRYNSTFFYTEHYAGLKLKIHLWNAKKRK